MCYQGSTLFLRFVKFVHLSSQKYCEVKNKVVLQLEDPPLSLNSCLVDIAYDYTKRKNVFRLTTSCGEYYFQANDQLTMFNWIRVLQEHSQLASGKVCCSIPSDQN